MRSKNAGAGFCTPQRLDELQVGGVGTLQQPGVALDHLDAAAAPLDEGGAVARAGDVAAERLAQYRRYECLRGLDGPQLGTVECLHYRVAADALHGVRER